MCCPGVRSTGHDNNVSVVQSITLMRLVHDLVEAFRQTVEIFSHRAWWRGSNCGTHSDGKILLAGVTSVETHPAQMKPVPTILNEERQTSSRPPYCRQRNNALRPQTRRTRIGVGKEGLGNHKGVIIFDLCPHMTT